MTNPSFSPSPFAPRDGAPHAGTPHETLDKMSKAFIAALASPDVKAKFANLMAEPVGNTPEQFGAFMKSEIAKWSKVAHDSGAHAD